jgi:hypothetical protein
MEDRRQLGEDQRQLREEVRQLMEDQRHLMQDELQLREDQRQLRVGPRQLAAPAPRSRRPHSSRPGGSIGRVRVVEICAICHEDFALGDVMAFGAGCSHYFHGPCIDRWLQGGNTTCPVCREDFS